MPSSFLQFLLAKKVLGRVDSTSLAQQYEKGVHSLDELILDSGKVDIESLLKYKGEFYHVPTVTLEQKIISRQVLGLFPKEVITNYQIVPFEQQDDTIRIAMVNPENLKAREAVDFIARQKGWNTQFYVATTNGFKHALDQYSGSLTREVGEALQYADKSKQKPTAKKASKSEQDLEEVIKSAPVSKMVNVILRHAVEGGASDIHIEPQDNESRVRYRIDGDLHSTLTLPKYIHNSIVSRIKLLCAPLKFPATFQNAKYQ